jgi:hypothetical protein
MNEEFQWKSATGERARVKMLSLESSAEVPLLCGCAQFYLFSLRVRLIHFPAAGRSIRSDDTENP